MRYCNGRMYTIKSGDTLYGISMRYRVLLVVWERYVTKPGDTVKTLLAENYDGNREDVLEEFIEKMVSVRFICYQV